MKYDDGTSVTGKCPGCKYKFGGYVKSVEKIGCRDFPHWDALLYVDKPDSIEMIQVFFPEEFRHLPWSLCPKGCPDTVSLRKAKKKTT